MSGRRLPPIALVLLTLYGALGRGISGRAQPKIDSACRVAAGQTLGVGRLALRAR